MSTVPTASEILPDSNSSDPKSVLKKRVSRPEKLAIIAPGMTKAIANSYLEEFRLLFARKGRKGIMTSIRGEGARSWYAFKWEVKSTEIIRHLVGNELQSLPVQWFGTRSWQDSNYFVIDIDRDRSPVPSVQNSITVADEVSRPQLSPNQSSDVTKLPFATRCEKVDQCLLRLGIDASDARHVLKQVTPSGGLHCYVFLDEKYLLSDLKKLLEQSGIKFQKGQIEFFPSTSHALRLPFGHLPGRDNDPTAWLAFLEKYRSGAIRRFALQSLQESLLASGYEQQQPTALVDVSRPSELKTRRDALISKSRLSNISQRSTPGASPVLSDTASLLDTPESRVSRIQCHADFEKLIEQGICVPGTRNGVLKMLATHLIFFQQLSAMDAETFLVDWAMNPRHKSVDIQADLRNRTNVVAKEIAGMCAWYEKAKDTSHPCVKARMPIFSEGEIQFISYTVSQAPPQDQEAFASFLLHFLNFAKRHGSESSCRRGWEAAPAAGKVMRRWVGCSHMKYKRWIELAEKLRVLRLTMEKWQNPRGKGRARTYLMYVPVAVRPDDLTLTLKEALAEVNATVIR